MWWWMGGAAVVLLIVAVMRSDIRVRMKYVRQGKNDELEAAVSALFGLVTFRRKVPVIEYKTKQQGLHMQISEKELTYSKDDFELFLERLRVLRRYMKDVKEWVEGTLRHIHVVELRWDTRFGLGDAAETGMAGGVVWGVKSAVIGAVSRWVTLDVRPKLEVTPLFQETAFSTSLTVRAKIKVYELLFIVAMLLFRVLRKKGGWKVWFRVLREAFGRKRSAA